MVALLVLHVHFGICRMKKYPLDGPNVHALGAVKTTVPPRPICEKLQHHFHHPINLVKVVFRLHIRDGIFNCKNYTRVKKRNSYTVLYEARGHFHYGKIIQFYVVRKAAVACIQQMVVTSMHPFGESIPIVQVEQRDHLDIVDVRMIHEKCLCIEVDDNAMYICRFPSKILCD